MQEGINSLMCQLAYMCDHMPLMKRMPNYYLRIYVDSNKSQLSLSFNSLFGYAWPCPPKITTSICSFNRYLSTFMEKINFITPIVFEILKLENLAIWLAKSISAFNHDQLKLHDQSVTLIDMKLHAQNQLYTSFNF